MINFGGGRGYWYQIPKGVAEDRILPTIYTSYTLNTGRPGGGKKTSLPLLCSHFQFPSFFVTLVFEDMCFVSSRRVLNFFFHVLVRRCRRLSQEVLLKEIEYINVCFLVSFFAFWLIEIGAA